MSEKQTTMGGVLSREVDYTGTLPEIKIKDFAGKLTSAIGVLFKCLVYDPTIRSHPVWGKMIPFNVLKYGQESSLGHCVRPDLVITDTGEIKICELDCAPSGRGFLLKMLEGYPELKGQYLQTFFNWYKSMTDGPIVYGTGTKTICFEETDLFSSALRQYGLTIHARNVDTTQVRSNELIDRLFYRSELFGEDKFFSNYNVITAEPFLDSKMVLAVIHDAGLETFFKEKLGEENFIFLKNAVPETYSLDMLRLAHSNTPLTLKTAGLFGFNNDVIEFLKQSPGNILQSLYETVKRDAQSERSKWLIKTGDVEEDTSWGSRSVVLGVRTTASEFTHLLKGLVGQTGKGNSQKNIGDKAILQRFHKSKNFEDIWNLALAGSAPALYDKTNMAFTPEGIKDSHVYARVTFFMLLTNKQKHLHTDVGHLTLRRQPLAHGSTDAMQLPFILS